MRYHKDSGVGLFSADERLEELKSLGDPLLILVEVLDFEFFRPSREQSLYGDAPGQSERAQGGRPPYDPVLMFKILVLQRLYNLSDDAIEFQIKDRLSFMRFLGLDFAGRVPDAKTVWLFRDLLQKKGLVRTLFDEMNAQLEARGIIAHSGQIVDASFVEAPRQRNSRAENETIKAGEIPEAWTDHPAKLCQKDVEARWAMKGGETHFGYKNHVLCDRRSKLLVDYQVTDAAVHESTVVESLVETGFADGESLYGDSAYRSAAIEDVLAKQGMRSRIHYKGYRDHPLSARQQKSNRSRSRVRARVEHVFAFMTDSMGGMRVRACGRKRNEVIIGLMNLTYNLCRLVQLNKCLLPIRG